MKTWRAAAELVFATSIWGFGFTATIWALKSFDTITITIIRFGLAFVLGVLILLLSAPSHLNKKHFRTSFWPGICLGLMLTLQTWGLEYTSATNGSFITTLYVVIVPFIEMLFMNHKIRPLHFVWVIIALIGTMLMVNLRFHHLNPGDMLTLVCAVAGAVQIVFIGYYAKEIDSPFAYNTFQSFWACLVALLFLPIYHHLYYHQLNWRAVVGLISLCFASTLLAFFLQVRSQKVLSASLSSLLCLLESPFALLFAFLLIGEKITLLQALGGALIILSAAGATIRARERAKQNPAG